MTAQEPPAKRARTTPDPSGQDRSRDSKPSSTPTSTSPSPVSKPPDTPTQAMATSNTKPPPDQTATAYGEQTLSNPDAHISASTAISFWTSQPPSVTGVLCGLPQLSKPDLQGSYDFLNSLRQKSSIWPKSKKFPRVVDCGAGVGRITLGLLTKVAETVDIVEPVKKFTDVIGSGNPGWEKCFGQVGRIYNVGLEDWNGPGDGGKYGLIWNQWCLSQLTDDALREYMSRSTEWLLPGGWSIAKENISVDSEGRDLFDPRDSSVRRTDEKFRRIFEEAGWVVVKSRLQRGFPGDILPVRMYALQVKA